MRVNEKSIMHILSICIIAWITIAVEAANDSCILKPSAECEDLCDDALLTATYVEGILHNGSWADFSCLAELPNIKWVNVLQSETTCANRTDFKGMVMNVDNCETIIEVEKITTRPITMTTARTTTTTMKVTESVTSSKQSSSTTEIDSAITASVDMEKQTNRDVTLTTTASVKAVIIINETNMTSTERIIVKQQEEKTPSAQGQFIKLMMNETDIFAIILSSLAGMFLLGIGCGLLLIYSVTIQRCLLSCRQIFQCRKGRAIHEQRMTTWMLRYLRALVFRRQDPTAYSELEKKKIFEEFRLLVDSAVRTCTLVETQQLINDDEGTENDDESCQTESRSASAACSLLNTRAVSQGRNLLKRKEPRRMSLKEGAVAFITGRGISNDGAKVHIRMSDLGEGTASGLSMNQPHPEDRYSDAKLRKRKISVSDDIRFTLNEDTASSPDLVFRGMDGESDASPHVAAEPTMPPLRMAHSTELTWDYNYDLFPL